MSEPAAKPSVPGAATFLPGGSKTTIGGSDKSYPQKLLIATFLEIYAMAAIHKDDNKDQRSRRPSAGRVFLSTVRARDHEPHVQEAC